MTAVFRLPLSFGVSQTQMKETLGNQFLTAVMLPEYILWSVICQKQLFSCYFISQPYGFPRQIGRFFKNINNRPVRAREVDVL